MPAPLTAESRRDRQLRLTQLSDKLDARTLLLEVRRQKQLRVAGWLEVVDTTKNAQWRATEKLANADFRKPAPLQEL